MYFLFTTKVVYKEWFTRLLKYQSKHLIYTVEEARSLMGT